MSCLRRARDHGASVWAPTPNQEGLTLGRGHTSAVRALAGLTGTGLLALGGVAFLVGVYFTGPESIFDAGATAAILSLTVAGFLVACAGLVTVIRGYGRRTWLLYGAALSLYALGCGLPFAIAEGWEGFF